MPSSSTGRVRREPPLLFLDVDGPLNPYAAPGRRPPRGYTAYAMRPAGWAYPRPLRVLLNAEHGERLRVLSHRYTLVWATTWKAAANEWIGPRLGLPDLPYVDWPPLSPGPAGTFWKTRTVVEYAGHRPFAWVDDEIGTADREWAGLHHRAPASLMRIDPARGLVDDDFTALEEWAESL
ncbi:HAD domain-containing protein [Streptomyces sp. NPDC007088]|uniref:HAD domain-containing protein n=1 Tax=Streptomyces sp. NPDC007088 TaxID=3364773 RepID=UPI0036A3A687